MLELRPTIASLFMLVAGCSRPASSPATSPSNEARPASHDTAQTAVEGCVESELAMCKSVCRSSGCLRWCAGEPCAQIATKVAIAWRQHESDWLAANPEEAMSSQEAWEKWHVDKDLLQAKWWREQGQPMCRSLLADPHPAEHDDSACAEHDDDWRYALVEEAPDEDWRRTLRILVEDVHSALWLEDPDIEDEYTAALAYMVRRGSRAVQGTTCPSGETELSLELDDHGRITALSGFEPELVKCIEPALKQKFVLPARVAKAFPELSVHATVNPPCEPNGYRDCY